MYEIILLDTRDYQIELLTVCANEKAVIEELEVFKKIYKRALNKYKWLDIVYRKTIER